MLPFGIGFSEVLVVMVVILLVIGPNKLPDLAKTLGKGVRAARRAGNELKNAINIDDDPYPPPRPWMQQNTVSDAESELVDEPNWSCDGEGGFDPAEIPGLEGTVAYTGDEAPDGASEDEVAPTNPVSADVEEAPKDAAADGVEPSPDEADRVDD